MGIHIPVIVSIFMSILGISVDMLLCCIFMGISVSMFLSSGNAKEGYVYGQHHPKVRFDDSVLYEGSAAYVYMALRWLSDHKA